MRAPTRTFTRRMMLVGGGAVAVITLAVSALLALGGANHTSRALEPTSSPSATTSPSATANTSSSATDDSPKLASLPSTAEPDVYAELVAGVVFGLDTRTVAAGDYRRQLRGEADPNLSGQGRADLYATIEARIPANALWRQMRRNAQWSQWAPSRTWEPAAWAQVVTGGYAEPGWVMRNVEGTQTTHYLDATGAARTSTRVPTLSVVMRCPAPRTSADRCSLVLISTTPVF